MKNVNRIVELLKQVEPVSIIGSGIKINIQKGNAVDYLKMIVELKELDEICPVLVQHALKGQYDEIKTLLYETN